MTARALVAIDPGFAARGNGCAVAVFRIATLDALATLERVFFARPEMITRTRDATLRDVAADLVVWECPQVDARTRVSVPAVVQLAATGGTLAGLFAGAGGGTVEAIAPSSWKGSTPKPVAHGRLWTLLTSRERDLLGGAETERAIAAAKRAGALKRWAHDGAAYYPRDWTTHNLLDAVGIGAWRLGRAKLGGAS